MMHQNLLKDFGMIKKLGRIKIMITQENIPYTADEIKAMVKTCEKYNKALDMGEKIYHSEFKPDEAAVLAKYLPMLFPEIKEDKDERIRKVIYGWIYSCHSDFFDNGFSKEEMLDWVENQDKENQDKENHTYRIYNTPNCGITVYNEECKESKDERMKEQLCDFLRDNMLYQDAQEITSWLEKLIENQKY